MNSNPQDLLNLFSKLTWRRFLNLSKVWLSYHLSRFSKKVMHPALPAAIAIEPTTSCNLRCPECPSGLRAFSRPTGMLEMPLFQKAIDELAPDLLHLTFYFQGEPFLHPRFLEMVRYASEKNIYTATSTNAHYLTDEKAKETVSSGLDRLIISIDGTTQESYEQYRVGGSLEKVLEGTRNLVHWKKKLKSCRPHLIFQFLVVRHNEHQLVDVRRLAKEYGVNEVVFKTAQIYDYENGSPLIPLQEKYARYRKGIDGKYKVKNSLDNHCWKMWHSAVITWDGAVLPCCFDKDGKFRMGNLQHTTFREVWNNETYRDFRASLLRSRQEIEICKNCSEGTKVWA